MTQPLLEDLSYRFKISLSSPYGNSMRYTELRQAFFEPLVKVVAIALNGEKIKMIRIRKHRGDLAESMETCREIPATKQAICEYLNSDTCMPFSPEELATLEVKTYCGEDKRIGWEQTCIVLVNGSPCAFTDGPLLQEDDDGRVKS